MNKYATVWEVNAHKLSEIILQKCDFFEKYWNFPEIFMPLPKVYTVTKLVAKIALISEQDSKYFIIILEKFVTSKPTVAQ